MDSVSRDSLRPTPLVTATVAEDESVTEVILEAFLAARVDVLGMDRTLQECIDGDLVDCIDEETAQTVVLAFSIWGHRVVVTPGLVELYKLRPGRSGRGAYR